MQEMWSNISYESTATRSGEPILIFIYQLLQSSSGRVLLLLLCPLCIIAFLVYLDHSFCFVIYFMQTLVFFTRYYLIHYYL